MIYATTYPIGDSKSPRRKTAKTSARTGSGICNMDANAQRCRRNPKGQTKVSASEPIANGFLRTKILPKIKDDNQNRTARETQKLERDFYRSLSRLAKHYRGFEPTDMQSFDYPYNIAYSLWEAENYLKQNNVNWDALKFIQDGNRNYLLTEERYFTGTTLYYIPVIPLFFMQKDRGRKRTAHLLLSVFCYLYHIAGIPYYRDASSYLNWEYEMLSNWIEDDDSEEHKIETDQIKQAECIGDLMGQKIYSHKNLEYFQTRLNSFHPHDTFEKECLALSLQVFKLYQDYPSAQYSRYAKIANPNATEDDEVLRIDMYVSFYANSRGALSKTLFDCVNDEFANYAQMEEPAIINLFDGSPIAEKNLDFEARLFDLIDSLIYLLNTYYDSRYE